MALPNYPPLGYKDVHNTCPTVHYTSGGTLLFPTGKKATVGGIVTINGSYYGVTAFHPSVNDYEERDEPRSEIEGLKFDNNDNSECSTDYNMEDIVSPLRFDGPSFQPNSIRDANDINKFAPLTAPTQPIGQSRNGSRDLGYLIFPMEDSACLGNSAIYKLARRDEFYPRNTTSGGVKHVAGTEVQAKTSTTGTVKGVMLSSPRPIKMPGSTFQEMWPVRMERKLAPGDCGSWVVDNLAQKLYGQIVAGDPNSSIAYIVPAYKIFDDIMSKFGTEAVFPLAISSPPTPPLGQGPPPNPSTPNDFQEEGIAIPHRFPGSTLLVAQLSIGLTLTIVTTVYTYCSRYRSIQATSPILPPEPHQAIIIIQLLMYLSVKSIQQCFLVCSERLRWILAAGGTSGLTFHILGPLSGFWALVSVVIAKLGGGQRQRTWWPQPWRLLALFKLVVLHCILMAAPLVWLFGIDPQTVYGPGESIRDWVFRPGFGGGVGDFGLVQGFALPFSPWRVFGHLSDATRVSRTEPWSCSTETDLHCAAYVLMGFSGLVVPNPDQRPQESKETAVIINDMPTYVVQFSSGEKPTALNDSLDPWLNCANYTSKEASMMELCLGLQSSPIKSSRVAAGWRFCLAADNCTEVYDYVNGTDAYNNTVFTTTMDIYKANASVIIDVYNGTILDVYSIGKRVPYAVNQSEFFAAFTAPFSYTPVNVTTLLESDYLNSLAALQAFSPISLNSNTTSPAEIKAVNDGFLDSLVWSFVSPLPSESPAVHLRGFLSYALALNSGFYYQPLSSSPVRQTYALNVRSTSLLIYTTLNISVWLISVAMLLLYRSRALPRIAIFPELTFAAALSGGKTMDPLYEFSNIDTGRAIEQLWDVRYYLGEYRGRVALCTQSLRPLRQRSRPKRSEHIPILNNNSYV